MRSGMVTILGRPLWVACDPEQSDVGLPTLGHLLNQECNAHA